jgi:tRNA(Ile2) C34 agmatinyltransferase TiaS
MIYIGLDDTDTAESRGTGRLAREIAAALSAKSRIFGVTRHQLFVHPDIPFTTHNSCAVIHAEAPATAIDTLYKTTKKMMLDDFIVGSDPGLAVASEKQITSELVSFGLDTKKIVVTQARAKQVAKDSGVRFESLGGTGDGIIGAIAGIGLASLKNDGRFLLKGRNRELAAGARSVSEVLDAGIDEVRTLDGLVVNVGDVEIAKNATPSFIKGKAVLFVEQREGHLVALKRD